VTLELPLAAALGAAMLLGFLATLGRSGEHAPGHKPIVAEVVVLPPEPKPAAPAKPLPEPAPRVEHPVRKPVIHRPPPKPRPAEPQAATPVKAPVDTAPPAPTSHAEAAPPAPAATSAPAPVTGALSADQMSARAILRPMPQIPDELRAHALNTVAVVRFDVAPDGSATATLLQATPSPQLNELLLEAFKRWRFFPALRDGKPVASVLELRVPVKVE
jgi:protein TonB